MSKKIIFLIILIIIPFIVSALPLGDVDGNGKVGSTDYVLVRKHLLKQSTLTGDRLARADVNGDKKVNSLDFVAIRKLIISGGNVVTPTPQPTTADGICESVKNNASIDYKSFASLKKDNDDYYVMKAAHDCANKYNKPVVVTKDTYHIYKKNKADAPIIVQTNTDFSGSTIYIHDDIDELSNYMTKSVNEKHNIFYIKNGDDICTETNLNTLSKPVNVQIPNDTDATSFYVYVKATSGNQVWQRVGDNEDKNGSGKSDSYRINITNGTREIIDPLFWNYSNIPVKVTTCIIENKLTFGNVDIKTVVNKNITGDKGKYTRRGIYVDRSNVVLNKITHSYIDSVRKGKLVSSVNYKYQGIFKIVNAANVTVKDSKVYSLNANGQSTYDISINDVAGLILDNVTMYNDDLLLDNNRWGVMGTSGCKNVVIKNSKLDRIDAHRGMYNLKVENSTIGNHGIQIIGSGDKKDNVLEINKSHWVGTNNLIFLRHDYGETWNGSITITNSDVSNVNSKTVNVIKNNDFEKLDSLPFKHPIYSPSEITIKGLTIKSSDVKKVQVMSLSENYYKKYYVDKFGNKKLPKITADIKGVDTVSNYS